MFNQLKNHPILPSWIIFIAISSFNSIAIADNTNPHISFVPTGSDSASIYDPFICNVGIKHESYNGKKICYSPNTNLVCNKEDSNNCVCSSVDNANTGDYLRYTLLDNPHREKTISTTNTNDYEMVYNSNNNSPILNIPITSAYFILGSELYGAAYFLDVCYREQRLEKDLEYKSYITDTMMRPVGKYDYLPLANLNFKFSGSCWDVDNINNKRTFSSSFTSFPSGGNLPVVFTQKPSEECVVRYEFKETTPNRRKWQLNSSRMQIKTQFEEPKGCTLTQGYWKTHGNPTDTRKYDPIWDKINPNGSATRFLSQNYSYNLSWMDVLESGAGGNFFYILGKQFIATALNNLNDVKLPYRIDKDMETAEKLFKNYESLGNGKSVWNNKMLLDPKDPTSEMIDVDAIKSRLDDFNNGDYGVPHCGE